MNCKEEFLEHLNDGVNKKVLCAIINHDVSYEKTITYILPQKYTATEYSTFINYLDFEYDSGYGGQELFGTIWYKDGTWSERGEYDGSEWWNYKSCPEIPSELIKN